MEDSIFTDQGTLDLSKASDRMKEALRWVNWHFEERDERSTKVPLNARTGQRASSTDPETWSTFEMACQTHKACGNGVGVGFVLGGGFVGIDLDKCRDPQTGIVESWAMGIVSEIGSYCEISPSGTGLHIIAMGKLPPGRRRSGRIEAYDKDRFFCVTGDHLPGSPEYLLTGGGALAQFHEKYLASKDSPVPEAAPTDETFTSAISDEEIIRRALASPTKGERFKALFRDGDISSFGGDDSLADMSLCNDLAYFCSKNKIQMDRIFRTSALMRPKWDSKRGEQTYGSITIDKAVRDTRNVFEGGNVCSGGFEIDPVQINATDLGNARRLVAAFGDRIRYCPPWNKWLLYDGTRWEIDDEGLINRLATEIPKMIVVEAMKMSHETDEDRKAQKMMIGFALRTEEKYKLQAMIDVAKCLPGIPVLPELLDRDPWALNCQNGTIDLKTGELRPHFKEDYITKLVKIEYDPLAKSPLWANHMFQVFQGKQDMIGFVKRALGYSCSGLTDERCWFNEWGPEGYNGKTTINETVADILNDYSVRTPVETLLIKRDGAIPNDVARLKGARFVFASETEDGKRLAEALIKDLTGGDKVSARFLRGEFFDFTPQFKLWLGSNHRLVIRGTDASIWGRIRLIKFNYSFPPEKRIPKSILAERFRAEYPGILAWLVQGCVEWRTHGLGVPEEVEAETRRYRSEMDTIGDFIRECCVEERTTFITSEDLYRGYANWCTQSGEKPLTRRMLSVRLIERGFINSQETSGPLRKRHLWRGIRLNDQCPACPA